MPILGVTGGIATGKSSFTRLLLQLFSAELFDADHAAHDLLENDIAVRLEIADHFGRGVCDSSGKPDRHKLRAEVFANAGKLRQLEQILHPRIRSRWQELAVRKASDGGWLLVDIPLLFETHAEANFDCIIVVACTPATQRHRLLGGRALNPELAEKIISSQLGLGTKINQAHHVIWNDSTFPCLERQAGLLAAWLHHFRG